MPDSAIVISNTTPLLYLHEIGMLELLRDIYGHVHTTRQVVEELSAGGVDAPDMDDIPWIKIRETPIPPALKLVPDLGAGEASVIALALERGERALLLLDDRLARRLALLLGVRCVGTAGILMKGKEQGLIEAVRPLLERLIKAGFYLRQQHLDDICALAGEKI